MEIIILTFYLERVTYRKTDISYISTCQILILIVPYKRIYTDVTESSNINVNRNSEEYGRIVDCAAFADVDNDGDLDLVTSIYYHRWEYYNTPEKDPGDRSEVLLNDGNGNFTLVENSGITDVYLPEMMTVGLTNTTGISFLDYDQDGNIDMYFSEWFADYKSNLEGLGEYKLPDLLFKGTRRRAHLS
jgi:hypothetical protein